MVMQTVRSRSHSAVLPYIVTDMRKAESPPSTRESFFIPRSSYLNELPLSSADLSPRSLSPKSLSPKSRLRRLSLHAAKDKPSYNFGISWLIVFITVALTFYLGSSVANEIMKQKVNELEQLRDRLIDTQSSLNAQLQRARKRQEEEMRLRQSQLSAADSEMEQRLSVLNNVVQSLQRQLEQEREAATAAQKSLSMLSENQDHSEDAMRSAIQRLSRDQAVTQFGPGPHYAQFTLNVPGSGIKHFTVEFASLDYMPLTVNNVLHQIQKGLWDDSAFYLRAPHVMIARPISWDLNRSKRDEFGDLMHVPFPEYSPDFPHVQYTLGLNGRPAGPDFYINMMDNTVPHGPKGHQSNGSAEPCFAKVILGVDTIDHLGTLSTRAQDDYIFERPVQIVHVRMVDDLTQLVGGSEYLALVNREH